MSEISKELGALVYQIFKKGGFVSLAPEEVTAAVKAGTLEGDFSNYPLVFAQPQPGLHGAVPAVGIQLVDSDSAHVKVRSGSGRVEQRTLNRLNDALFSTTGHQPTYDIQPSPSDRHMAQVKLNTGGSPFAYGK